MKKFYKKVDLRSRKKMIDFLENHFRYDTLNSWNCSKSFANNMKIYNLELPKKTKSVLDYLYCSDDWDNLMEPIEFLISEFEKQTNYEYTAMFNGASGGYLVLYKIDFKPSGYKSYCTHCGQENFTSVTETGSTCGRCGNNTRIDYTEPPMQKVVYFGRSIGDEDYEDKNYWDISELRDEVKLVQLFDKLCDDIVDTVVECSKCYEYYAENCNY